MVALLVELWFACEVVAWLVVGWPVVFALCAGAGCGAGFIPNANIAATATTAKTIMIAISVLFIFTPLRAIAG